MKDLLHLYPIQAVEFEEKDGLVVLLYKNLKPSFIEKIFFKKQLDKEFKIDLDKIGSFVWKQCNGKHSIKEIISLLESDFDEELNSVNERVQIFIGQLHKNKFINLFEKRGSTT